MMQCALLLPTLWLGSCNMLGCDPGRRFDLDTEFSTTSNLTKIWSHTFEEEEDGAAVKAVRCVAVLTQIICSVDRPATVVASQNASVSASFPSGGGIHR